MRFLTLSFMLFSFQIQAGTDLITEQELGCLKSAFLYSIQHETPWTTYPKGIVVQLTDDYRIPECKVSFSLSNDEYCSHHEYFYIVNQFTGKVIRHSSYQICEQG